MNAILESLKKRLPVKEHPILPWFTDEELLKLAGSDEGVVRLVEIWQKRQKAIEAAEEHPLQHGFELEPWKKADQLLGLDWVRILAVFGGNRASKSEWAGKRVVKDANEQAGSLQLVLSRKLDTGIITQQKLIWKYLPQEIKALNTLTGRNDKTSKIRWTEAGGFTEYKLVLPNRSTIIFASFTQDPKDYEGLELGAREASIIGAWADEDMPLAWLNMLKFRLATRAAKMVWTFTPTDGITPTIKELLGVPVVEESLPAEMLKDRVNVPGLPKGHMPYVSRCGTANAKAIYFFSIQNPFGNYREVAGMCKGQTEEYVERRLYGYARDTKGRLFPHFGAWNLVKREHLPVVGTDYMFCDPHGMRNWAAMWVRVTPGKRPSFYVYREWPDCQTYGEWAVPSSKADRFDGDMGPAQSGLGFGVEQYKRMFLRLEEDSRRGAESAEGGKGMKIKSKIKPGEILERYMDPRGGKNAHVAEKGGTCTLDKMFETQRNPVTGEITGPSMPFSCWSGVDEGEGLDAIKDLLFWQPNEPMDAVSNAPQLYVVEDCQQTSWALNNYTARDGQKAACKEWVDMLRGMALAGLRHVTKGEMGSRGGYSY